MHRRMRAQKQRRTLRCPYLSVRQRRSVLMGGGEGEEGGDDEESRSPRRGARQGLPEVLRINTEEDTKKRRTGHNEQHTHTHTNTRNTIGVEKHEQRALNAVRRDKVREMVKQTRNGAGCKRTSPSGAHRCVAYRGTNEIE